jgi:LAS superfamily LD-carboxypeptidase LdcB
MHLSFIEKQAANEIIACVLQRIKTNEKTAAISFSELHADLSAQAIKLSEKVRSIRPHYYGINRQAVIPNRAESLVVVRNQYYATANGWHDIPPRLVPRDVFRSFQAMNYSMKKDIGNKLVIQSGYRSPAYQLFIFLFQLKNNDWSTESTLKTVALPGYSEHAAGNTQGLDLRASKFFGPHDMYDFSRVPAYRWMLQHAREFGFSLSYPKNNSTGTDFEPWHWRHGVSTT